MMGIGSTAAVEVVREAALMQREGAATNWIREMNQPESKPVHCSHTSPGVTVDFGLHDGQLKNATMLDVGRFRYLHAPL